ncbi:MAG TPA: EfeM/EfeO family lipoprotein [Streptosporangiaceae bacterium]|jgi:iron uptake system component EfeO
MTQQHLRRPGLRAAGAVAVIALAAAGCGTSARPRPDAISITTGACGGWWHLARPGWHTFTIRNSAGAGAEVNLVSPATGAIYAEIEGLGPNTSRAMSVNVGSGTYAFRCLIQDTDTITGPSVRVGGHQRGAPGIVPVTSQDLVKPASEYHAYVTAGLTVLVRQTQRLAADIRAGNLSGARSAWLPAHLTYERLGAAYGTFDDFDGEIDARADGLPGGVHDRGFTGFYRLEYGLWDGQSAAELTAPAGYLLHAVKGLQKAFPSMEVDLLDVGLRTHEILENALQFQLTGHDDYGSGTTLATTAANITGTRELLTILHPILASRYQGLPGVSTWLDRLSALLRAQDHHGRWTPVSQLSMTSRQQIDAAAGEALQVLAPIAVITEPRRT